MIEPNRYHITDQNLGELTFDRSLGFYRDADERIVSFRRQAFVNDYPIRPSEDGTLGEGVYIGNTVESLECFKTATYMRSVAVIKIPPIEQNEVFRVNSVPKTIKAAVQLTKQDKAETIDQAFDLIFEDAKFIVWKTQVASNIGSLILGHVWPRNAHWGLWRDKSTKLVAYSEHNLV